MLATFLFSEERMAFPNSRELSYGSVEIHYDEVLGIGAYGKVCKAKCGQLPSAAKLLHDNLFQYNDPGTRNLTSKFLQECQFLSTIKHPNIVQYLGTASDPQSRRPVLLMELMDESLTKFLERLTSQLPYHSQLNICHDIALALAYLHSNAIIHRDLSSNNVLLIGEGSRAKVTDFGMSKLLSLNPRNTPLTQAPGTPAYMPPEALTTPPFYSGRLDCFSLGVLTLQIAARKFPNPGSANRYREDPNYPTGRVLEQFPEVFRRKEDIDQVEPSHPLLPTALDCLKDRDTERPSADELCEKMASLKREPWYTQNKHLDSDRRSSLRKLLNDIETKEHCLLICQADMGRMKEELASEREKHQRELVEKLETEKEEHQRNQQSEREQHRLEIKSQEQLTEQLLEECRIRFENEDHKRRQLEKRVEATEQKLREAMQQKNVAEYQLRSLAPPPPQQSLATANPTSARGYYVQPSLRDQIDHELKSFFPHQQSSTTHRGETYVHPSLSRNVTSGPIPSVAAPQPRSRIHVNSSPTGTLLGGSQVRLWESLLLY